MCFGSGAFPVGYRVIITVIYGAKVAPYLHLSVRPLDKGHLFHL